MRAVFDAIGQKKFIFALIGFVIANISVAKNVKLKQTLCVSLYILKRTHQVYNTDSVYPRITFCKQQYNLYLR